MLEKANKNINNNENISGKFASNPINTNQKNSSYFSEINEKLKLINNSTDKSKEISGLVDLIYQLPAREIGQLMCNENDVIRGIASRAFVDKENTRSMDEWKIILKDSNEFLRDSAVNSLCYINSPDMLELLEEATKDKSIAIKLKALTGIADIASEYSLKYAVQILERFRNDQNPEIRDFVNDELSLLD